MIERPRFCVAVLVASLALLLMPHAAPAWTAAPTRASATVVSVEELAIRSCPELGCETRAEAPLGGTVVITGDEVDGFVPVEYDGQTGYAQALYLATDPTEVPYLLEGEEGCQRIALIFNVGIGEPPAEIIFDTLEQERVPATMFVMGWWADQHPEALDRMVEDGFPIGSHGYDRIELTTLSADEVVEDIQRATAAIEHATGEPPLRLFTPYAAAMDERVRAIIATEGYLPVFWTVTAADYGPDATGEAIYDRIMGNIHDGTIVELHLDGPASAESTGRTLPRVVRELRARGYRFVTIPEMTEPCRS